MSIHSKPEGPRDSRWVDRPVLAMGSNSWIEWTSLFSWRIRRDLPEYTWLVNCSRR